MKKFFFFLSAIALLGLASACVEQQEVNPNYNPETREVNANFVFNIATNNSPMTKQTAANTQANVASTSDFLGISNGKLFAYKLATAGNIVTSENPEKLYDLPNIVPAGSIGPNGEDKSRRILELSIPTETNAFLFYGKAPKSASNNFDQGLIDYTVNATTLASNAFSLKPIVVVKNATGPIGNVEGLISYVLTKLLQFETKINPNDTKTIKWSDYGVYDRDGFESGLKWKCTTINPYLGGSNPITPLGEIVGNGFANFVSVRSGAVRAGSGPSVARMIGDLAVSLGGVAKATPTSPSEEATQKFARALLVEFAKYFDICDGGTLNTTTYANVTTDADRVDWSSSAYGNAVQAGYSGASVGLTDLQQFPTAFDLPMGAAQLIMNDDPQILTAKYPSQVDGSDINIFNGSGSTDVAKFTYPAELCYFGNSPIRVNDETVSKEQYPDGAGNDDGQWLNEDSWTGTNKTWTTRGGTVTSSTRSVAMADNINYGTALFGYTIGYSAATLEDNTKGIPGLKNEEAKTFSSSTAGQFTLTGILIGGQYKTVGWNYLAKAGEDNNTNYIVYDKLNIDVPTGTGTPNDPQAYTMVWDNYNASASTPAAGTTTAAGQDAVYVALEFKNNTGGDFWGEKNVIRKDGMFYIVGKLTVPSDVTKFQWPAAPDYYALPPYKNGATDKVVRVFMQDYMTLAHFTLGANSLKHAYVTVPDLRTGQLSLGLSVDLQWRQGLTLPVVLGETN